MRILTLLAAAAACAAGGCEWMKNGLKPKEAARNTAPIAEQSPDVFVTYLNQQSVAIQSIEFDTVRVSAQSGSLLQQAVTLEGDLYCAKPRQFRLRLGTKVTTDEVDVGSNQQYVWMFVKRAQDPKFVYCSHEDLATGKASLPIPFDAEWVLQALGMTTYDPGVKYEVVTRQREREFVLTSEGQTPQGVRVKKFTVFTADPRESETTPVVKKQVIQDMKGNMIATAEVVRVKKATAVDPKSGQSTVVLIPTEVNLTFQGPDKQQMKLSMRLDRETINAPTDEKKQKYLFTLPTINGSNPINLADYRFTPTARGQAPGRGRRD